MRKIMNILMLSCRKATELIERRSLFGIDMFRKIQLFMHLKACDACKNYETHSNHIDLAVQKHLENANKDKVISNQIDSFKEKLISELEDKYF